MNLEEKRVFRSGLNLLRNWRDKEWWYSGIYDPHLNIYISFFFARVNVTDHFSLTIFDPTCNEPMQFAKNLFLDKKQEEDKLSLNYYSSDLTVEYNGDEKIGWKFRFINKEYEVNFEIKPTAPYFTKYDNHFVNEYSLLHFFFNTVKGTVQTPVKKYEINHGLGYYDHCFGKISSRVGWHWIAVQNQDIALASLVNYGAYSQKYTQTYFKNNEKKYKLNQWIRLSQDVSFEYQPKNKFTDTIKATSCDMDLNITPIMSIKNRNRVPYILPFFVNITHYEVFIKVDGKLRIEREWVDIENLYGIMEEHYGKW